MTENEKIITQFYEAFKNKDYTTMQSLYDETCIFNDPAFVNLNSSEVKAMWQMLLSRSKDLILEYSDIKEQSSNTVSANWTATYTFSVTGNQVINHVNAIFEINAGKIIKHTDSFSFYKWASQALGIKGILLGWTSFLKKKVQETAKNNLIKFINNKNNI